MKFYISNSKHLHFSLHLLNQFAAPYPCSQSLWDEMIFSVNNNWGWKWWGETFWYGCNSQSVWGFEEHCWWQTHEMYLSKCEKYQRMKMVGGKYFGGRGLRRLDPPPNIFFNIWGFKFYKKSNTLQMSKVFWVLGFYCVLWQIEV